MCVCGVYCGAYVWCVWYVCVWCAYVWYVCVLLCVVCVCSVCMCDVYVMSICMCYVYVCGVYVMYCVYVLCACARVCVKHTDLKILHIGRVPSRGRRRMLVGWERGTKLPLFLWLHYLSRIAEDILPVLPVMWQAQSRCQLPKHGPRFPVSRL